MLKLSNITIIIYSPHVSAIFRIFIVKLLKVNLHNFIVREMPAVSSKKGVVKHGNIHDRGLRYLE
jgi:hypothetical protein